MPANLTRRRRNSSVEVAEEKGRGVFAPFDPTLS